jgi:hypothetical protein
LHQRRRSRGEKYFALIRDENEIKFDVEMWRRGDGLFSYCP